MRQLAPPVTELGISARRCKERVDHQDIDRVPANRAARRGGIGGDGHAVAQRLEPYLVHVAFVGGRVEEENVERSHRLTMTIRSSGVPGYQGDPLRRARQGSFSQPFKSA